MSCFSPFPTTKRHVSWSVDACVIRKRSWSFVKVFLSMFKSNFNDSRLAILWDFSNLTLLRINCYTIPRYFCCLLKSKSPYWDTHRAYFNALTRTTIWTKVPKCIRTLGRWQICLTLFKNRAHTYTVYTKESRTERVWWWCVCVLNSFECHLIFPCKLHLLDYRIYLLCIETDS